MLLGKLNQIRREHPALQQLRDLHFHHAPHADALVYSKKSGDDVVIVVVSVDPHNIVETEVYLDMEALGLTARDVYLVMTSSPTDLALGTACLRQAHSRRSGTTFSH